MVSMCESGHIVKVVPNAMKYWLKAVILQGFISQRCSYCKKWSQSGMKGVNFKNGPKRKVSIREGDHIVKVVPNARCYCVKVIII